MFAENILRISVQLEPPNLNPTVRLKGSLVSALAARLFLAWQHAGSNLRTASVIAFFFAKVAVSMMVAYLGERFADCCPFGINKLSHGDYEVGTKLRMTTANDIDPVSQLVAYVEDGMQAFRFRATFYPRLKKASRIRPPNNEH